MRPRPINYQQQKFLEGDGEAPHVGQRLHIRTGRTYSKKTYEVVRRATKEDLSTGFDRSSHSRGIHRRHPDDWWVVMATDTLATSLQPIWKLLKPIPTTWYGAPSGSKGSRGSQPTPAQDQHQAEEGT